jgi:hypothetical protein
LVLLIDRTILTFVGKEAAPYVPGQLHLPHARVEGGVVLAALQEAGIPTNRLLPGVAGCLLKGCVDVLYAAICIRDDDAVGHLFERCGQPGQSRLGAKLPDRCLSASWTFL